jgi:hypothetical protein
MLEKNVPFLQIIPVQGISLGPTQLNMCGERGCTCSRLIGVLGADEILGTGTPYNHVPCKSTMVRSVLAWAEAEWERVVQRFPSSLGKPLMVDRVPDLAEIGTPANPWTWPLYDGGRHLGLVIRQWAIDSADSALANRLESDPVWQMMRDWERMLFNSPDPIGTAKQLMHLRSGDVVNPRMFDRSEAGVAFRLRQNGLPYTPQAVQHLQASAQGNERVSPTRGVLVTTKVYLDRTNGQWVFHDRSPHTELIGPLEYMTKDLFAKAYDVAEQHRAWLRQSGQRPITTMRAIHQALPTAFHKQTADGYPACETIDYYEEATDPARITALRDRLIKHGGNRESLISQHLRASANRVRQRRRRSGVTTTPPDDHWQSRARGYIRELLKAQ